MHEVPACSEERMLVEARFRLSAKRTSPFKSAGGGGGGVSSVDYWQPRCAHQRQ